MRHFGILRKPLLGALASTSLLSRSYCQTDATKSKKPPHPTTAEIDADLDIITKEIRSRIPQSELKPVEKHSMSFHGASSSGKSSFINEILGFQVKARGEGKVDDYVTVIVTANIENFKMYLERHEDYKKNPVSVEDIKRELLAKSKDDFHKPALPIGQHDSHKKYVTLVVDEAFAQKVAKDHGLLGLSKQKARSKRLRAIIINEFVYQSPEILKKLFPDQKYCDELSREDRAEIAKSLVVVDTPGIEIQDEHQLNEVKAITSQVAHSIFLLDSGAVTTSHSGTLQTYADAIKSTGSKNDIWGRTTFLLTKVDETVRKSDHKGSEKSDAPPNLLQRWYEFGTLFGSLPGNIPAPVFNRCFAVGLPSQQGNTDKYVGSLPDVFKLLQKEIIHRKSNDFHKMSSIFTMAQALETDIRTNPQVMDSVRYVWLGDVFSGDFLKYKRPYTIATELINKYDPILGISNE